MQEVKSQNRPFLGPFRPLGPLLAMKNAILGTGSRIHVSYFGFISSKMMVLYSNG